MTISPKSKHVSNTWTRMVRPATMVTKTCEGLRISTWIGPCRLDFVFLKVIGYSPSIFLMSPRFCQNIANPSHHLREYPVRFGFKLVDMYPEMTSSPMGRAPFPNESEVPPALTSFLLMEDTAGYLEFSRIDEVFNYLRRGKHLLIPAHWREHVPKPM